MIRPFSSGAEIDCRSYSLPLQRVIADFGADVPFGKIPGKLQEHHGISVPVSSAQSITQRHAQQVHCGQTLQEEIPSAAGVVQLVAQMDGTSIPIVETRLERTPEGDIIDRRKTRQVSKREARLSLVRPSDSKQPHFGTTFGSVDEAGAQLLNSAIIMGMGCKTQIHGVGDGAPWIALQFDTQFGDQSTYLLDFFHLSEYLAEASQCCAPDDPNQWLSIQKSRLKANQVALVLAELEPFLEADSVADPQAPVRCAYRYMSNRPDHLDYQGAINAELPIGSGEIESAHRYVILDRLDIAGAWWTVEKAEHLMSMMALRENGGWDSYWKEQMPYAA
ncbi:MAG: ISKra4 family transposase [Cyanobacteria bacterium P01_H01_bin.15]